MKYADWPIGEDNLMKRNAFDIRLLPALVSAAVVCVLLAARCFALDPDKKMTQFSHQAWGAADGIGRVNSIAQTKDGYLWFGTARGLLRFDGVQFTRWESTEGERVPEGYTAGLLARRDGSLWSTSKAGWFQMHEGRTDILPRIDETVYVAKFLESADGAIWAAARGMQKFTNGHFERMDLDSVDPNKAVDFYWGIVEDHSGTLWVSAARQPGDSRSSIAFLAKGETNFIVPHQHLGVVHDLQVAPDGTTWAAETGRSVRGFIRNGNDIKFVTPEIKVGSSAILFDRDGALWVTTVGDGLRRIRDTATMGTNDIAQFGPAADIFTQKDGLSSDTGLCIFQDREGNIWIGTVAGLDCFQENKVTAYSVREGLPSELSRALATGPDGSIWAGNLQGFAQLPPNGKNFVDRKWFDLPKQRRPGTQSTGSVHFACRTKNGRMLFGTSFGLVELRADGTAAFVNCEEGKFLDEVLCVSEARNGGLWVDDVQKGLGCLYQGKLEPHYKAPEIVAIYEDSKDRLWVGARDGGLFIREAGKFSRYLATNTSGLIPGEICSIWSDGQGRIVLVGDGGISRFDKGSFTIINRRNGLPEDHLAAVVTDDNGDYWFGGAGAIFRLTPTQLDNAFAAKTNIISTVVYDLNDGLRGFIIQPGGELVGPLATKGPDGKLWFSTAKGLAVIDPAHIPRNSEAPPVHIQKITAAGKTYQTYGQVVFPAGTRSCEIDYAGLGIAKAMKVRYKCKLAGADLDWVDAGTHRQALYQNLRAGKYKFQVLACNCDGVWNESGDSVEFRILPTFYETAWFPPLCALPVALAVWGLYRLRLARVTGRIKQQLDGQIKERKRIAQELHDTLLQGFTGLGLKFDALANSLPPSMQTIKEQIQRLLDQSDQYLTEARRSVWDLRSATLDSHVDFSKALVEAGERVLAGTGVELSFSLAGAARKFDKAVENNLLRICEEATANAVKHGHPTRIEVNLEFKPEEVVLLIRDNGSGFDPKNLKQPKDGHFGLVGMKERAESMSGRLVLNSQPGKGTELVVTARA
jgi:ligand-binding sensor domain-containing protein/anti-sigma regulatory factor (Ser/Thr protein kinase)